MDELNTYNHQTGTVIGMNSHLMTSSLHPPCLPALPKKDSPSLEEQQRSFGKEPEETEADVSNPFDSE